MDPTDDRQVHDSMSVVGIRARLTAAAVVQMVKELGRSGALDAEAVERIKDAIVREGSFARRPHIPKERSDAELRVHIDRMFADAD